MSRDIARNALVVAGLGGLAWYLLRAKNASLPRSVNPASDQNFIYQGASAAVSKATGLDTSPGVLAYDLTHSEGAPITWQRGALTAASVITPFGPAVVAATAEDAAKASWAKIREGTGWLASVLNIASFL